MIKKSFSFFIIITKALNKNTKTLKLKWNQKIYLKIEILIKPILSQWY